MSILSEFEDRIAGAVEGVFAGAFKSPVQPAEFARRLGKAMDDGRVVGVGKVYAPTSYTVVISEGDEERMEGFLEVLEGELATYLIGHAQEHSYELTSRPEVLFEVDDELRLGRFEVEARMGADRPSESESTEPTGPAAPEIATVTVSGTEHDVALRGDRLVVGRLASCGIVIEDANVSREHATFVPDGAEWAIEDLGSTNGTLLNGRAIKRQILRDGDVIQVGVTKLVYHAAGVGR